MAKSSFKIKPADLVVVAGVLLAAAATYFLAVPSAAKLQQSRIELQGKQAELEGLELRHDTLVDLANELPNYKKQTDLLTVALPAEPQTAEALTQAMTMAQKSGLSIEGAAPSASKGGILPVNLSVKGTFAQYDSFTRELAKNLRPVTVKTMNVTRDDDKNPNLLTMNFSLEFEYSKATAASPSPVATAASPATGQEAQ